MTEQEAQEEFAKLLKHEHLTRLGMRMVLRRGMYRHSGMATYSSRLISIDRLQIQQWYWYIKILCHEMAHIVARHKHKRHVKPHGREFRRQANRLYALYGLQATWGRGYETKVEIVGKPVI